jgi:hypothetical protein
MGRFYGTVAVSTAGAITPIVGHGAAITSLDF